MIYSIALFLILEGIEDPEYRFEVNSLEQCIKAVERGNEYLKLIKEDKNMRFFCAIEDL